MNGGSAPVWLDHFDPAEWSGGSDYRRWEAWDAARREWADTNLPGGSDELPSRAEWIPDQLWSEVAHLI